MRFTWDEKKRQSNLKKHGIDFKEGHLVFAGATFSIADTRVDYGEDRFATLGLLGVERERKMSKKSTLKIPDRFDEHPEITQADIDRARFRVNLQDAPRKQRVNIMLDTGVIAFFKSKAGERGYQTLINAALKQAIQQEELEATLRRIVREELTNAQ